MATKGKLQIEETQATEMAQSENHRLTIQHVPVSPWLTLSSKMTQREKKSTKGTVNSHKQERTDERQNINAKPEPNSRPRSSAVPS